MSSSKCVFQAFASLTHGSLHFDFVQLLYKEVAVFCVHDTVNRSTKHFYTIFLECAVEVQFSTAVEGSLTTECQEDAIGTLLLDDFSNEVCRYRQEIYLVRNAFRSLNCSNVRIDENRTDAFFAKCLQGLRT